VQCNALQRIISIVQQASLAASCYKNVWPRLVLTFAQVTPSVANE